MFKKFFKLFSGFGITGTHMGNLAFKILIWIFGVLNMFGKVGDDKIFLGSESGFKLYLLGDSNIFETETLKNQIKRGDVVLDIGAHIGYYTLLSSRIVGEEGKAFAFEPDLNNFRILEKNIKANNCKNVRTIRAAVSDKVGEQKLYLNKRDSSRHTLYDIFEHFEYNYWNEVEGTTLDTFFEDYDGKIDFIKMDIEGSEGWALQGMKSILEKNKQIKIFSEFNFNLLNKSGFGARKYLKSIIKLGFKLHYIDEEKRETIEISIDGLIKKRNGGKLINILCIR